MCIGSGGENPGIHHFQMAESHNQLSSVHSQAIAGRPCTVLFYFVWRASLLARDEGSSHRSYRQAEKGCIERFASEESVRQHCSSTHSWNSKMAKAWKA